MVPTRRCPYIDINANIFSARLVILTRITLVKIGKKSRCHLIEIFQAPVVLNGENASLTEQFGVTLLQFSFETNLSLLSKTVESSNNIFIRFDSAF